MTIQITCNISSEDDVVISLDHAFRGVKEDLTKYLVYELLEENSMDEEEGSLWELNMTLPYPYSQASGDLTLNVEDSHSGDVTTTRLIIKQEGHEMAPFFDPVPKSVQTYPGQDVLINTRVRGSTPINVSMIDILLFDFSLLKYFTRNVATYPLLICFLILECLFK